MENKTVNVVYIFRGSLDRAYAVVTLLSLLHNRMNLGLQKTKYHFYGDSDALNSLGKATQLFDEVHDFSGKFDCSRDKYHTLLDVLLDIDFDNILYMNGRCRYTVRPDFNYNNLYAGNFFTGYDADDPYFGETYLKILQCASEIMKVPYLNLLDRKCIWTGTIYFPTREYAKIWACYTLTYLHLLEEKFGGNHRLMYNFLFEPGLVRFSNNLGLNIQPISHAFCAAEIWRDKEDEPGFKKRLLELQRLLGNNMDIIRGIRSFQDSDLVITDNVKSSII